MTTERYPDQSWMISAAELARNPDGVVILDLRPAEDFALGHIAGARHLDIYGFSLSNSEPAPLEAFLAMFQGPFGARGVSRDRPVIVYDHESGERAARAAWLLATLDHPDVRLLDGGVAAWTAAGQALTRKEAATAPVDPAKAPPTPPPFAGGRRLEFLATRFDVAQAIGDPESVILDVRRRSEYSGEEKRARRAGAVPGAIHAFWRDHLNAAGAFRPSDEVRAHYKALGVTPNKKIIAYCQGGYRSANTFLALKALGYPNVRNYVGSWAEWGNRDDADIETPA